MDPHSGAGEPLGQPPAAPPPWPAGEVWQPPPTWPSPPPAPHPHSSTASHPKARRRWPLAALVLVVLATAGAGVAAGAAASTASATSMAARLEASGDFSGAIAVDREIEGRTGLLYAIDASASSAAARAEQQTRLAWARALGREGKIDEAVAVYRSVTAAALHGQATQAIAALLYAAATADAARGAYPSAILRLDQIVALAPDTPDGAQAHRQLPIEQAADAQALLTAGHGADAVAMLDTVVQEGSAAATSTANAIYPEALLVAGQEDVAQQSFKEAAATLERLVSHFAGAPQVEQAEAMLTAPVSVSGTLVDKNGVPQPGAVRLSTNYKAEPGGTYKTSGPFSTSTADSSGDFIFTSVPVGGPYVLEVFSNGAWTTLVDPISGQPAHPVTVTALVPVLLTFVVLPS
jgi:hypothetical protein